MKKSLSFGILLFVTFVFVITPCSFSDVGEIAIFTESVGWTSTGTANAAAQIIMDEVTIATNIQKYSDADIGTFATEKSNNDDLDIIITFGYFPVSLYTPGNGEADDSVGEKFLEAGNMFMNSADYIFYVTQGGGANGDTGLKNMTDSNFDLWTDGNTCKPVADGEKYTPSLKSFTAPRSFKVDQIETDDEWELEVAFGMDKEGGTRADPAVIHNTEYDGRVCIFFQVSDDSQPRGEVAAEILNNWLSEIAPRSVEPADKLPITWGEIKIF